LEVLRSSVPSVSKITKFFFNRTSVSIDFISDIDYELKSSSFDIRTMIENLIIKTCSKGGFDYAKEN